MSYGLNLVTLSKRHVTLTVRVSYSKFPSYQVWCLEVLCIEDRMDLVCHVISKTQSKGHVTLWVKTRLGESPSC